MGFFSHGVCFGKDEHQWGRTYEHADELELRDCCHGLQALASAGYGGDARRWNGGMCWRKFVPEPN